MEPLQKMLQKQTENSNRFTEMSCETYAQRDCDNYNQSMWPLRERRGIKDVASAVKEKTASEVKQQSYEVPPAKDVELRLTDSGQYSLF